MADADTALHVGHLVQDESFTLYDAVGALEVCASSDKRTYQYGLHCYQIMDPKMDGGYLADGESLDDDYDVLRELSMEELLGIIDQLLCFEVRRHNHSRKTISRLSLKLTPGMSRWRGTWAFLFIRPCSLHTISSACSVRSQSPLAKPYLIAVVKTSVAISFFILFLGLSVLV